MDKVLVFKVGIKGLENKIWRKIEIKDSDNLADLVYLIMATFEIYSNEFFLIIYDNKKYDSAISLYDNDEYKSAMSIKLQDLLFDSNKEMLLEYNYQFKIIFIISYIGNKDGENIDYPVIVSGAGKGVIDYVSSDELKQIVDETDKLGHSNYSTTIIWENDEEIEEVFDYRDFELKDNNMISKINLSFIKDSYEFATLLDILRITKDRQARFFKTDIKELVSPFDYIRKYIPDNYDKLSYKETRKLNIPEYADLKIYRLPEYQEINHKEIMTLYVKRNIEDKEVRQALFYALRNDDYLDKYYNKLRKYGLFKDYLDYTNSYYKSIIQNWIEKNNIEERIL